MNLSHRLARLEAKRLHADKAQSIAPELMAWIIQYRQQHGSFCPDHLAPADIALWNEHTPDANLAELLATFARIDAEI
jgi:hypothetical protein